MKSFSIFRSMILLVSLALLPSLLPYSIPNVDGVSLVKKTCKRTPYYDLCVSSLMCYPNSSSADVEELAGIAIDLALLHATDTLEFTRVLIHQTIDPLMERPLDYCAELYIPVVKYTVPQGRDAFDKGQYKFAEYCLSDAAKQADRCENMFSGSVVNPMGGRNRIFQQLCSVAMAIIDILLKDQ